MPRKHADSPTPPTRLCGHLGDDPGWWLRVTKYKPDEWLCTVCHPPDPEQEVLFAKTGGDSET